MSGSASLTRAFGVAVSWLSPLSSRLPRPNPQLGRWLSDVPMRACLPCHIEPYYHLIDQSGDSCAVLAPLHLATNTYAQSQDMSPPTLARDTPLSSCRGALDESNSSPYSDLWSVLSETA